jgi:precorrin-6Y C5,15-methyltransferase (decarboxylating)
VRGGHGGHGRLHRVGVTVVGIGADGLPGLAPTALEALRAAEVIAGSSRQLGLLDDSFVAQRFPWPTPMMPAVEELLREHRDRRVAVLASGDPTFYGVGARVVELAGSERVRILPALSSMSLACARLGWPMQHVEVVSLVGRPHETVRAALAPGRRLLVLLSAEGAAADVSRMVTHAGYGESPIALLEQLGGPDERIRRTTARAYDLNGQDYLSTLAIDCVADPDAVVLPRTPGLPDEAFETEGQLTKREVRALTLAALVPVPGQLLWDVGAGSGSVGIEWMRVHPDSRAFAIEARADRCERIVRNAAALGVPGLQVVNAAAPDAFAGLPTPEAIFVGGAVSVTGVLDACVAALRPGARLVANAVTVESESVLAGWFARLGGSLTRLSVHRAEPVGTFSGWRPAMPVTQWSYRR